MAPLGFAAMTICLHIIYGYFCAKMAEELQQRLYNFLFFFFLFFFVFFFRAAPTAYGGSQARGLVLAIAAGLHHSHSNARSKPHLRPTP